MSMRNASDDLRISRSHETNGQAYLRRVPALAREFVYHNHCVSFVVYLPNKIHTYEYDVQGVPKKTGISVQSSF